MSAGANARFHRQRDGDADSTHSLLTKLCLSPCQALWGILRSTGHVPCLQVWSSRKIGNWASPVPWGWYWDGEAGTQAVGRAWQEGLSWGWEVPPPHSQVSLTLPSKGRAQRGWGKWEVATCLPDLLWYLNSPRQLLPILSSVSPSRPSPQSKRSGFKS